MDQAASAASSVLFIGIAAVLIVAVCLGLASIMAGNGYSFHVPLRRGTLKIKSENRLSSRERSGKVPTFRLFSIYFVWEPKAPLSH
jgi:hypothetical protein